MLEARRDFIGCLVRATVEELAKHANAAMKHGRVIDQIHGEQSDVIVELVTYHLHVLLKLLEVTLLHVLAFTLVVEQKALGHPFHNNLMPWPWSEQKPNQKIKSGKYRILNI